MKKLGLMHILLVQDNTIRPSCLVAYTHPLVILPLAVLVTAASFIFPFKDLRKEEGENIDKTWFTLIVTKIGTMCA